jgi:acyl-CoA thioester hydrolase
VDEDRDSASSGEATTAGPRIHEHRFRVRYAETDQMGVVHHANYLIYLEESRTRFMAELGCSYAELERSGWLLPVRRAELRYRAPARYDEELVVRTRVERLRGASVTFSSDIVRASDGAPIASGEIELACIDSRGGDRRPTLLPADLREKLESASSVQREA